MENTRQKIEEAIEEILNSFADAEAYDTTSVNKIIALFESELQFLRKENKRLRLEKRILELGAELEYCHSVLSMEIIGRSEPLENEKDAANKRIPELLSEITSLETQLKENG